MKSAETNMAPNGRGMLRPNQSSSSSFIVFGLVTVVVILAFNYWNSSSKNSVLLTDVSRLQASLKMCREQYVLVSKQKRDLESSRNRQSGGADTTGQELVELQEKYAKLVKQNKQCSTASGRNQSDTVGTDTSLDELKQEMADLQIRHDRLEGDNKKLQDNVTLCRQSLVELKNMRSNRSFRNETVERTKDSRTAEGVYNQKLGEDRKENEVVPRSKETEDRQDRQGRQKPERFNSYRKVGAASDQEEYERRNSQSQQDNRNQKVMNQGQRLPERSDDRIASERERSNLVQQDPQKKMMFQGAPDQQDTRRAKDGVMSIEDTKLESIGKYAKDELGSNKEEGKINTKTSQPSAIQENAGAGVEMDKSEGSDRQKVGAVGRREVSIVADASKNVDDTDKNVDDGNHNAPKKQSQADESKREPVDPVKSVQQPRRSKPSTDDHATPQDENQNSLRRVKPADGSNLDDVGLGRKRKFGNAVADVTTKSDVKQ